MNDITYLISFLLLLIIPIMYICIKLIQKIKGHNFNYKIVLLERVKELFNNSIIDKIAYILLSIALLIQLIACFLYFILYKKLNIVIALVACILALIMLLSILSILLIISDFLMNYIFKIKSNDIVIKLTFTLIYNIFYTVFCLQVSNMIVKYYIICWLTGIAIAFLLLSVFIDVMVRKKPVLDENVSINKWSFILFMICITFTTLALLVEVTRIGSLNAYHNLNGIFDSLYFVIISFCTIGYGDIYPINNYAKIDSILIAINSIVFLVAFFNTFMNNDDKKDATLNMQ